MKNQYFGDVGDYGKYAMLRYLANDGIKIAVNWYLMPDCKIFVITYHKGTQRSYIFVLTQRYFKNIM